MDVGAADVPEQGKRPEFQGGGLVRSAGGNKAGLLGRKKEAREKGDARILGSGDFVNEALSKAGEEWESQTGPRPSLKALINTVSEAFDLSLSPSSVSRIVESGENILDNKKDVAVKIADMEI